MTTKYAKRKFADGGDISDAPDTSDAASTPEADPSPAPEASNAEVEAALPKDDEGYDETKIKAENDAALKDANAGPRSFRETAANAVSKASKAMGGASSGKSSGGFAGGLASGIGMGASAFKADGGSIGDKRTKYRK